MTPLIRFALGLVAGGLAVKTLRNTVFQGNTPLHPSDASPDSSPAAAQHSPPEMDAKRAGTPSKKRSKPAAPRTKTSP